MDNLVLQAYLLWLKVIYQQELFLNLVKHQVRNHASQTASQMSVASVLSCPSWKTLARDLLTKSIIDQSMNPIIRKAKRNILLKIMPIVKDTIKDMLSKIFPVTCIKVADLGCASGPNAFLPAYEIMDTITRICHQSNCESSELQVFLNDLSHNDFNTVFRLVLTFHARLLQDKGDLGGLVL
ncbi:hypothetical protein V6N11_052921 [Hibiscus sabdariffa]|uniref:Uncharacterized protein n=1 Tax=Hibiscus sabdariffa TaxID=183260 RepID=A0ABR2UBH6_9ROSI